MYLLRPLRIGSLLLLALLSSALAHAAAPSPLRVGEGGRALVNAEGRPVFLLADTAWSIALRATREEAEFYLRQRKAQHFNAVTFVLFAPGKTELMRGDTNAYGDTPFANATSGAALDPTRPLTTPSADPGNADAYDYWDHVDYVVRLTRELGLYAILLPTWGSGVIGSYNGKDRSDVIFNEANARTYGRWVAERYRGEPHVIWMLGGDRAPVQDGVDSRPTIRAMAEGIRAAAPGHLISYHPRKGAPQSGAFFHDEAWLAFNSVQEWPDRQIPSMAEDWARTPPKPTWLFEGRYEGYWRSNYKPADWGAWQMRQQAYQTVLAGAFGHTYGHERTFGFGLDGAAWRDFIDAPGARNMTMLARLMAILPAAFLLQREPDQSLVEGDAGKAERLTSTLITAARTRDGRHAVLYSANGRTFQVRLERLARGPCSAMWYNPRTGLWHANGVESDQRRPFATLQGGAGAPAREFSPPSQRSGEDWVLVLEADAKS